MNSEWSQKQGRPNEMNSLKNFLWKNKMCTSDLLYYFSKGKRTSQVSKNICAIYTKMKPLKKDSVEISLKDFVSHWKMHEDLPSQLMNLISRLLSIQIVSAQHETLQRSLMYHLHSLKIMKNPWLCQETWFMDPSPVKGN